MNLNIVNLHPKDWCRQDWTDAYAGYCTTNAFGVKTKREYYDWVLSRTSVWEKPKQLDSELSKKWIRGRENARQWAKEHGCDLIGRTRTKVPQTNNVSQVAEISSSVEILRKNHDYLVESLRRNLPMIKI